MLWQRIVYFVLIISGLSQLATACTCVTAGDEKAPITSFSPTDVVFRGKLVKVEYLDRREDRGLRRFIATFEVSRVWSGAVSKAVLMHTREGGTDCIGFSSQTGAEWIVFAQRTKAYDRYLTEENGDKFLWFGWLDILPKDKEIIEPTPCSLTSQIGYATKTRLLDRLGNGQPPGSPKS